MKKTLFAFLFLINIHCHGQNDTLILEQKRYNSLGVYLQYNGITKPYVELGLGKSTDFSGRHPVTNGKFIATEIKIDFKRTILAPKIGVWASGGAAPVSMGLNVLYYADVENFENGSVRIRPEFGLGLFNIRGYFGANIPVTNYRSSRSYVSLFTVGLMYYIPVIKWER